MSQKERKVTNWPFYNAHTQRTLCFFTIS